MKSVKKIIFSLIIVALIPLLYVGTVIGYGTITDYQPEGNLQVSSQNLGATQKVFTKDTVSLISWNIGYGGLGKEMDFFYDGGESVRPPKEQSEKYIKGIVSEVKSYADNDFILLQEVDRNSKRSYNLDQFQLINDNLDGFSSWFGLNYNVNFVPLPFLEPLGKTFGGLQTLSKTKAIGTERVSFPGNFSWPTRVFMLDRCFLISRFEAKENKELVIINTHNSAYDDGNLKKEQMDFLKKVLLDEYEKGNYVIAGGDWNQFPPNFSRIAGHYSMVDPGSQRIPPNYPNRDWLWAYDPGLPTNRSLKTPYDPLKTKHQLIDFFLISPNINLLKVKTIDSGFKNSDHQAVKIEVVLK